MTRTALFLILAGAPFLTAQQKPDIAKIVSAEAVEVMERTKIPGMTISVGRGGKVIHEGAWGHACLENRVPTTVTTRFRTASIAKPMTAVAVMQLVEQGKLDLGADVRTYLPRFPEKKWPIKLGQLLSHLGGVRHYKTREEPSGKKHYFRLEDTLALFADDPLLHQPGTKFSYTTFGFTLPGLVLEKKTGLDFEMALTKTVFEPAGMKHSLADDQYRIVPERSQGYQRVSPQLAVRLRRARGMMSVKTGDLVRASLHDTSMKVPGGGLLSTASDLVRFGIAVKDGKLVQTATRDAMWTEQKTTVGKGVGYGLGFSVSQRDGSRRVSHGGGQAGTSCFLLIFPDDDLVVAAMSNLRGAGLGPTLERIGSKILGR